MDFVTDRLASCTVVFLVGFDTVGAVDYVLGGPFFANFMELHFCNEFDWKSVRNARVLLDVKGKELSHKVSNVILYARNFHNVVAVMCDSISTLPPCIRTCASYTLVAPVAVSRVTDCAMWFDNDANTFRFL